MQEVFGQLQHAPLRVALLDSLNAEEESVAAIAETFEHFSLKKHALEDRKTFFATWRQTNDSAASVEGLAIRMADLAEASVLRRETKQALDLFRAAGRLYRVADEDLGADRQVPHGDRYERMSRAFTDDTDDWQGREFRLPVAIDFNAWLVAGRLQQPIMTGLYSTLVHEGYIQAELQVIAPLFHRWAIGHFQLDAPEAGRALAWITAHAGETRKKHFALACAALAHYCDATGTEVDLAEASEVFRSYLRRKAAVMKHLDDLL
jgi:hypothetical protein